jgi:hypothetical protein
MRKNNARKKFSAIFYEGVFLEKRGIESFE